MQPQGYLQVINNLIDGNLNPQIALNVPRFRWVEGRTVGLETSRLPDAVVTNLRGRGHHIVPEQPFFEEGNHWGGGQISYRDTNGALIGGSNPRYNGMAVDI